MVCNSSPLSNPCIATISCTGIITLKACIFFLIKKGPDLSYKKYECNVFYWSLLSKLLLHPRTQQQTIYKSVHQFSTPYGPLSMRLYTLINQAHNCKLLPFSSLKAMLECPQHASQSCPKYMYNPKRKINLNILSSICNHAC
jgi:hypothetical protein